MKDPKKKILTLVLVGVIMIIFIGATFAYFQAQGNGSDTKDVNVTTYTTDSFVFNIDKPIGITADQKTFGKGKENQVGTSIGSATLKANSKTNSATATYNVFFLIDESNFEYTTEDKTAELILSIKKNGTPVTSIDGLTPVTVGDVSGFDITERKENIKIAENETITVVADDNDHTVEDNWEVTVTLINLDSDQNKNAGKTLKGRLYLSKNASFLQVANLTTLKTDNFLTVNLNMTDTNAEIDKYYFAIEESNNTLALNDSKSKIVRLSNSNLVYQQSDNPSYTFTGLTEGKTYNIYGYAQDKDGIKSNEYKKERLFIETLVEHIKSLYTTQGSNNLYHYDKTLAYELKDNSYRYSGAYEKVNNWVCFGSTAEKCPDDNLYRIIGVFDSVVVDSAGNATGEVEPRVKLVKNNYAGESTLGKTQDGMQTPYSSFTGLSKPSENQPVYYWSGLKSNRSNNWLTSTLNTETLNGTYLTKLDEDGNNWSNKIAKTEWKIGGNTYENIRDVYAYEAYQNEIVNPATNIVTNPKYNAKIGLMYVSDYTYASIDRSGTLLYYNNDNNRNNNWLYRGVCEWTITPVANYDYLYTVFHVKSDGKVHNYGPVNQAYGIRPVFSLLSSIAYAGGEGTQNNPFRIN